MIDKEEFTMLYNDKLKTLLSTDRQHDDEETMSREAREDIMLQVPRYP